MAIEPSYLSPDPEGHTGGEMTLLEHLLELRTRVMWAGIWVMLGVSIFFVPKVGFAVIDFLKQPAIQQNANFKAQAISPMENVVVYFQVALMGGIAFGMPAIVYQALRFVSPALTPAEKRWVYPVTVGASAMFLLGLAFGYYVVLPPAYGFLFSFGSSIADPNPTITSYIDLTTRLILIMGFVFETPILIMGLAKMGLVSARQLWGFWRFAIVIAFVISAVATPTPDPITQTMVAGPMILLYFFGIGLAWLVRKN